MSYHHGNLRATLLARAVEVVDDEGVDALSMRQLARDAGVSHGATSRHFPERRALLDAVAVVGFERLDAALRTAANTPSDDLRDVFESVARAYVAFATTHARLLELMYTAKHDPDASTQLVTTAHGCTDIIHELVRRGQAEGIVRTGSADEFTVAAFASVHGLAAIITADLLDGTPAPAAIDAVLQLVWGGLTSD
ncbi:TetR/AcrR family transcriptional regulator [Pseudoclavibacter chungangensis]|uniref:TetR/AcrR family transcriptional regulator n=1 Tax=Pseudoclavibacter chungangensis TaxID=587635 RepID=A0A7J5BP33_9MICO|nr:TetR/AcrR family transcriptional regulator [Pseudoclavibacter chungangensis]KAB1654323.1 TetR/AcrR family transcriptional regulator [Pseudoclavibacter chungangensis]NYJ65263.1 AcrR family transcriptional regulator [Pseudoclavibacter chungangensis]